MSWHIKRKSIFNSFGFSLIEIMVTLGIAGAGAIGFMQLQKSNITGQKKTEVKYEANNLANAIGNLLLSEKNCTATLSSQTLSTSTDIDTYSVPKKFNNIKVEDASGALKDLYGPKDLIGSLEIQQFEFVQEAPLLGSADNPSMYGTINVAIIYKNISKLVGDDRSFRQALPYSIRVETSSTGNVVRCYVAIDDIKEEAFKKMCESIGGIYDNDLSIPQEDRCNLNSFTFSSPPTTEEITNFNNASSSVMLDHKNFKDEIYEKYIKSLYLKLSGDTFTGEFRMADGQETFVKEVSEPEDAINLTTYKELVECAPDKFGIFSDEGLKCVSLVCPNADDGTPQYLVGFERHGTFSSGEGVVPVCRPIVSGGSDLCPSGGKLKIGADGGLLYDCCTPECSSTPEDHCVGVPYPSSNNCGVCNDGTALDKDESFYWADTGETRIKAGATCSKLCGGGVVAIEKEQQRICNGDKQCGGAPCPTPTFQWVNAGTAPCNTQSCSPTTACSTSCDCNDSLDVCESGICVNRPYGTCISGTYAKGDSSCRYLCQGGYWSCPAPGPGVPTACIEKPAGDYQWCNDTVNQICACRDMITGAPAPDISLCSMGSCMLQECPIAGGTTLGGGTTKGSTTLTLPTFSGQKYVCSAGVWSLKSPTQSCSSESSSCNYTCTSGVCMLAVDGAESCCDHTPNVSCSGLAQPVTTGSTTFGLTSSTTFGTPVPTTTGPTSGGGGCFIAGSQVTMADRHQMDIEEVKVGDKLLTTSHAVNTVKKLLRIDYKGLIYSINGSEYFFTPNHPLKTLSGWKSLRPDLTRKEIPNLKVEKLKLGDILVKDNGLEAILSLDSKYTEETVYNFELDGDHEFIVNDIGVHNKEVPCYETSGIYSEHCMGLEPPTTGGMLSP